jgi:hydrogenase nickel incorporation protein HypA/HybF
MHEIGVVRNMLSLVLEEGKKASAVNVKKIDLVIGEMTGVVEDCVKLYMGLLSKGTIAEGAAVSVKMVRPLALCTRCRVTSAFKPGIQWQCPHCHNRSMQIAGGRELILKSIDIETEEENVSQGGT